MCGRLPLPVWRPPPPEVRNPTQCLPRLVCYIMSVKDDVTAKELNEDFRKMLGKRAGDIVMTEAERLMAEGEKRGEKRGREEGTRQAVERMFELRLRRKLSDLERETLTIRFTKLGPDRLGDVVLELSSKEVAAWLEDPDAR